MRIIFIILCTLFLGQSMALTEQFTLDNGLKILVKEDHRAPIAISMIWYNVGSTDEPGGITGISHVLEHLMFKGTKKYPSGFFSKKMAERGGEENAFTTSDYTAYHEKIAAVHLEAAFKLEADRMHHLLFNNDEFNKEMHVIEEERRLRTDTNPQALALERFLAAAHLASPYHHPVIGWMSDLKHMTIHDAQKWYQRFYAPNNATLVVVGDVKPSDIYIQAKRYFGNIPPHPHPKRKAQKEPPSLGMKSVLIRAPAQIPMLILGYTVPSLVTVNADLADTPYVIELIAGILEAGGSGRLNAHLVQGKQIAGAVAINYNKYARYPTQFSILGVPNTTHTLNQIKDGILNEINVLQNTLLTESELKQIKTRLIAQKTSDQDNIYTQDVELGVLETVGLGWKTGEQYVTKINQITPSQIQETAKRYFQEKNMTQAKLIPVGGN